MLSDSFYTKRYYCGFCKAALRTSEFLDLWLEQQLVFTGLDKFGATCIVGLHFRA